MASDASARGDGGVVRLSGTQVRCLAHPLRVRLLGTLRLDGPATSAQLARRLDTNTGATSYHLRRLADVGLVVEDRHRGTVRERWWQAAHRYSSWRTTDFDDDPGERAAADWLFGHNAGLKSKWRDRWDASAHEWSDEWRAAADSSDMRLELTPDQLRSMNEEIMAVIRRYEGDASDSGDDAKVDDGDVQPVMVLLDTFPAPDLAM